MSDERTISRRTRPLSTPYSARCDEGAPLDADVGVVGAGVVGCAVALALARRDASVVAPRGRGRARTGRERNELRHPPHRLRLGPRRARDRVDPPLGRAARPGARRARSARTALRRAPAPARRRASARRWLRSPRTRSATGSRPACATTARSRYRARPSPIRSAYTLALAAAASVSAPSCARRSASSRSRRRTDGWRSRTPAASGSAVRRGQLRRPARRRGGAARRRRLIRDLSAQGRVPRLRAAGGEPLERILLPVPTERTKGVLVFPSVDGRVLAGPTAVDQEDKDDWSVRPQARDEILPKAIAMWPAAGGRRADRRLCRAATRGTRRQLRDRAVRAPAPVSSTSPRSAPPGSPRPSVSRSGSARWLGGSGCALPPSVRSSRAILRSRPGPGGEGRRTIGPHDAPARHRRRHLGRQGDPVRRRAAAGARGAAGETAQPSPPRLGRAGPPGRARRRRRSGGRAARRCARRGRGLRARPPRRVGARLGRGERQPAHADRDLAGQALPGGARPAGARRFAPTRCASAAACRSTPTSPPGS